MSSTRPEMKRFNSTPSYAWRPSSPCCHSCVRSPVMIHRSPWATDGFIQTSSVPIHMSPLHSPRLVSSRPSSPRIQRTTSSYLQCTNDPASACRSGLLNNTGSSASRTLIRRWRDNVVSMFRWDGMESPTRTIEYVTTETTTDPESRATDNSSFNQSVTPSKGVEVKRTLSRRWICIATAALLGVCSMILLILALTVIIPAKIEAILYKAEMLVDRVHISDLTDHSFRVAMLGNMVKGSSASVELTSPEGLAVYHVVLPADIPTVPVLPDFDDEPGSERRRLNDEWLDPDSVMKRALRTTQIGLLFLEPMQSQGRKSSLEASGQVYITDLDRFADFCDDLFSNGKAVWIIKGNAHVSLKGLKFTNIKFNRALEIQGLPLSSRALDGLGAEPADGISVKSLSMGSALRANGSAYIAIKSSAILKNSGPTILDDFGPVDLHLDFKNETIAKVHAQSLPLALGDNHLNFEGEILTDSPALGPLMRQMLAEPALALTISSLTSDKPNVFSAALKQLQVNMEVATNSGGNAFVQAIRIPEIYAVPAEPRPAAPITFPSNYIPPFPNPAVRALLDRIATRRARRRRRRLAASDEEDSVLQEFLNFRSSEVATGRTLQQRRGSGLARSLIEGGLGAFQGGGPALSRLGQVLQGVSQSIFPAARTPERLSIESLDVTSSVEWSSPPAEIVERIQHHISKVNLTGPIEAALWHPFESLSIDYVSVFGQVEAELTADHWSSVGTFGGHFTGKELTDGDEQLLSQMNIDQRTNVKLGLLDGRIEAVKMDGHSFFDPLKSANLMEFLKLIFLTHKVKVRIPKAELKAAAVVDGRVPVQLIDDEYVHVMELQGLGGFGRVQLMDMKLEGADNEGDNLTLQLDIECTGESPIVVDSGPLLLDWIYSGVSLGPITVLNLHMGPGVNRWNVNVGMYPVSSTAQQLSRLVTDLMMRRDFRLCVGRRSQRSAEEKLWLEESPSPWTPLLDSILNEVVQACIILPNPLTALSTAGLFPTMSQLAMTILRKISKLSNEE